MTDKEISEQVNWLNLYLYCKKNNHLKILKWLTKNKFINSQGASYISEAIREDNFTKVKWFVETFNLNVYSDYIIYATDRGNLEIVKWLMSKISKGFDHKRVKGFTERSMDSHINYPDIEQSQYPKWYQRYLVIEWLYDYYYNRLII